MLLWYTKPSASGEYTQMPSPSTYGIQYEDFDANSFRSKSNGTLNDTVVANKMHQLQMKYNCLSETNASNIIAILKSNPIYVKAKSPLFSNGYIEAQFRCSKLSVEMLETGDYTLTFNMAQKKKVSGQ